MCFHSDRAAKDLSERSGSDPAEPQVFSRRCVKADKRQNPQNGVMDHLTQKLFLLPLTAFFAGALYFPVQAQEENRNEPVAASAQAGTGGGQAVHKKKPAGKKKAAKKKKAPPREPASGYKFKSQDSPLSYMFDKKGDPIVKKAGSAAGSAKKARKTSTTEQPHPQLKGSGLSGNSAARYACPMRDYERSEPGQCPKCGMTLVKNK